MNVEPTIQRMVGEGASREKVLAAIDALPGIDSGRTRHLEGMEVERMSCEEARLDQEKYALLRGLEIAAAPEVISTYQFDSGCLVVRRYWSCPEERLLHLRDSGLKLRPEARDRFVRDMQRLFDHGKLYPYIRGDAHWLVSERTGVIMVAPWLLTSAYERHRDEHFETIERTFARYS